MPVDLMSYPISLGHGIAAGAVRRCGFGTEAKYLKLSAEVRRFPVHQEGMINDSLTQTSDSFVQHTGFFFQPIVVPANWDDDKDAEYASITWGMSPKEAWAEIFERLPSVYQEIGELLDAAFSFLARGTEISHFFDPGCLPIEEKLDHLESLVGGLSPRIIADRERILLVLQACRHVDRERCRILRNFMASADGEDWAYPLVALVDTLVAVRMHLKEAFNIEVDGFAASKLRGGNQV